MGRQEEEKQEILFFPFASKVEMKTLLDSGANLLSRRGGGVVIALASRSSHAQTGQASQWAFGSQGFESLPRRHSYTSVLSTFYRKGDKLWLFWRGFLR